MSSPPTLSASPESAAYLHAYSLFYEGEGLSPPADTPLVDEPLATAKPASSSLSRTSDLLAALPASVPATHDDFVYLRMDDRVFCTSRSTLTMYKDSVLAVMFAPSSPYFIPQDTHTKGHPYLLDRDPRYFAPLLNFLRTGEVLLEDGIDPRGVLMEAKYFNIVPLIKLLEPKVEEMMREQCCEAEITRRDVVKALMSGAARPRFQGVNMSDLDLSGLDLSGANMRRAILKRVQLHDACLDNADFKYANLSEADLAGVSAEHAHFQFSNMPNTVWNGAQLSGADLSNCNLAGASMRGANLSGANLSNAKMMNADLSGANLKGAVLRGAELRGVNRQGVNLSMGGVIG